MLSNQSLFVRTQKARFGPNDIDGELASHVNPGIQ